MSDPARPQCPKPTCLVSEDVSDPADWFSINRRMPKTKLDTIEPVDIAARRQEPEETIGRLRNRVHASRRRTILCSPGGMHVLSEPFVRIEGVNRACQQQHADKTKAHPRRNRAARAFEAKQK